MQVIHRFHKYNLKLKQKQSSPIITKVVSSNATNGEVYSIQHYVIKFVDGLRQDGGFRWVLQFPPLIKMTAMIYVQV
jgi:hypothetical protein